MRTPRKNILLRGTCEVYPYKTAQGGGTKDKSAKRERSVHGQKLLNQLNAIWQTNEKQKAMFAAIREREGTYIEFKGAENCKLITNSLENLTQGIALLNVRSEVDENENIVQAATVFIPEGKETYFNRKVQEYLTKEVEKSGKEKNKKLVESIETIQMAVLSSFWIGDVDDIPQKTPEWCEIWLRAPQDKEKVIAQNFYGLCDNLGLVHKDTWITFPEKAVVLVQTSADDINNLINASACVAEIRRAPEVANFYTEMTVKEAEEWVTDLQRRLNIEETPAYVCILDTGVNYSHSLLKDVLNEQHVQSAFLGDDGLDRDGHGTQMAGLCQYFDLEKVLSTETDVFIGHILESVKILRKNGDSSLPELYGATTADAVSIAEIVNPKVKRVYCMAITADKHTIRDGRPSSWSGEVDNIIAGSLDGIRKLFVISAGNVELYELQEATYKEANILHSVEDPGQAWNAITVGAVADRIEIVDSTFSNWNAVADLDELCPFSSTSSTWDTRWPIKPDILMNGGNAITDGVNFDTCSDVSLLTTNKDSIITPFSTINATSAATAQAAYMAAELMHAYPELWEETIRALMIHSAQWTERMKNQFCNNLSKTGGIRNLLRCCGYGVASLERAKYSMDNSVNMIIQDSLQPYCKYGSKYRTKDMHLHELPWPTEILQSLGNCEVSMKVTLSYFVEAAPDQKGWTNRYRYPSSALRFEVIAPSQSKEGFIKNINKEVREEGREKEDKGDGSRESDRWFLGSNNRNVGSVHSDIWTGSAIDLATCKYIAVYPIMGWWRERKNLKKYNETIRYSLVVSVSTPNEEIDFYTPIQNIIEQKIETKIEI
ncbi:MAG: S8 family peptidase [Clostridia bacterium]